MVGGHWACFELAKGWQDTNPGQGKWTIAWAETVAIRLGLILLTKIRHVAGESRNTDLVRR